MEQVQRHEHTGMDSPRINGKNLVNAPQVSISPVAGSAGGTYDGTVQSLINSQTAKINDLILKLQNLGLLQ